MPTCGCEVQAEQPSDLSAYPVRFKPLFDGATRNSSPPGHARGTHDA